MADIHIERENARGFSRTDVNGTLAVTRESFEVIAKKSAIPKVVANKTGAQEKIA